MFCTNRVEYDGRVIIFISIDIGRILRGIYVIVPASISVIIIIFAICIIFSRNEVLLSLVIVWFSVRDFMLQSIEYFQIDGGSPHEPPNQLANVRGEQ